MGYIGEYTDPDDPTTFEEHYEVIIGKPGSALHLCFTTDCEMISYRLEFSEELGEVGWTILVKDVKFGTYANVFHEKMHGSSEPRAVRVPAPEDLSPPGMKSGFIDPRILELHAGDMDQIIGERLARPPPVPVEEGLGDLDVDSIGLGSPFPIADPVEFPGGRGTGRGGRDWLDILGRRGGGGGGKSGGKPLVGYRPRSGDDTGGGGGGGAATTPYSDGRPDQDRYDPTSGSDSDSRSTRREQRNDEYEYDTYYDEDGNVVGTKWVPKKGNQPDPMEGGDTALRGVAFLDDATMHALRVQSGFLAARQGPSRAIYNDTAGAPEVFGPVDIGGLDPIAPLAGGENYDPRRHGPPRSGAMSGVGSYVEALYPEAGGDGGGETVHMVDIFIHDRPLAPGAGGDPHAHVAGVDSVVGVGVNSVVGAAAGVGKTARIGR